MAEQVWLRYMSEVKPAIIKSDAVVMDGGISIVLVVKQDMLLRLRVPDGSGQ